jgi:tRNA G10  N-methylase Trm11
MTKFVAILGRQPALGRAELESIFGAEKIQPIGKAAAGIDVETDEISISPLGGSIKLSELLTTLPFTDWSKITDYLVEHVPEHTCCFEPGKLTFGISTYDFNVSPKTINATALAVKKVVKETSRPVRVVPNKESALSSAQVLHNRMTDLPFGMELILIRDKNQTILAQTIAVQNIEAYAARDQKRPKRDARVGMLPPKLAQIIINLAKPQPNARVLDPFCGTGVILQEALLMGCAVLGTDLEPRMIEYSETNLDWLAKKYNLKGSYTLKDGDATETSWEQPIGAIAAETYLGRPFSAPPAIDILEKVMRDVDLIHKKFLQNVSRQTNSGFRMCIAVPAWQTRTGFKHLKVLDSLKDLGYTRLNFVHASAGDLIYYRPGQIVGRELVVLERK